MQSLLIPPVTNHEQTRRPTNRAERDLRIYEP